MSSGGDLIRAEAEAKSARTRLFATLHEVQAKVSPRNIAEDVLDGARARGRVAVDAVRRNPGPTAAAVGVVAVLAARRPLLRLARRLFSRSRATRDGQAG